MSVWKGIDRLETADALARVAEVSVRLEAEGRGFAQEVATSLPIQVATLAPEIQVALARVAYRVAHLEPRIPEDLDALEGLARHLWDRLCIYADATVVQTWDDLRILRAVIDGQVASVTKPEILLLRCAEAASADLAHFALDGARVTVERCLLTPEQAWAVVERALEHSDASVRKRSMQAASEAWLATVDIEKRRKRAAQMRHDEEPAVVESALEVLAEAKDKDSLRRVIRDRPEVAARAWGWLGRCGTAQDLADALASPGAGEGLLAALLAMHRRGLFVRPEGVRALWEAFVRHHKWSAGDFHRVTFTVRDEVLAILDGLPADDPRWRRTAIVLALNEGLANGRTAHDVLRAKLEETTDVDNAVALLNAAAQTAHFDGEAALLAWLDALPEASLPALRIHGGERTTQALLERLEDPVSFGSARPLALDAVWAIAPDQTVVLTRLDARELSSQKVRMPVADAALIARVSKNLGKVSALRWFVTLTKLADVTDPSLARWFRTAFLEELPQKGASRRSPDVRTKAEDAAVEFGKHLEVTGRRSNRFGDRDDAGWLREVVLQWLDECLSSESHELAVALLELLARYELRPLHLVRIHRLWRHRDQTVRRAAMETLIGAGAEGLTLSLCALTSADDIKASRQGLRAIAAFEAHWAEPLARAAMASPNMNVKKTAAEALARVGTPWSLPVILSTLSQQDNPGLRETLLLALDHIAGPAASLLLVQAYENASAKGQRFLLEVMQERLSSSQLVGMDRSQRPGAASLIEAALSERLHLADDLVQLEKALHAFRGRSAPKSSVLRPVDQEGFSSDRAERVIQDFGIPSARELSARLPEWVQWAVSMDGPNAPPVGAAVLAAIGANDRHFDEAVLTLALRMETPDQRQIALRALQGLADADVRTRYRGLMVARQLGPTDPRTRWAALGRLGGAVTRADLERCLWDMRHRGGSTIAFLKTAIKGRFEEVWSKLSEEDLLEQWLAKHPLGISQPAARTKVFRKRPPSPSDLRRQLDEPSQANAAARALLQDEDAQEYWHEVLARYLEGRLHPPIGAALASVWTKWPDEPAAVARAVPLVSFLSPHRKRAWVPMWLDRWAMGETGMQAVLAQVPAEDVRWVLGQRNLLDDERWTRVLVGSPRHHARAWPSEAPVEVEEAEATAVEEDPLEGLDDVSALSAYIADHRGAAAARAVGRLGALGESATEAMVVAAGHRDAQVRTVALRWLKRIAPEAVMLETAGSMLLTERQKNLRRQLIRVLAYRRHAPSYPLLIDLVFDNDTMVARTAEEEIVRIGEDVVGALRKASGQARPDRRAKIEALQQAIETPE